jgi:pimeloyl-ACP methyl ester carboxylesterase
MIRMPMPSPRPRVEVVIDLDVIRGRVGMDQVMVDCGDDPVAEGAEVVFFSTGEDGAPTAAEMGRQAGPRSSCTGRLGDPDGARPPSAALSAPGRVMRSRIASAGRIAGGVLGTAMAAAAAAAIVHHYRIAAERRIAAIQPSGLPAVLPPDREYTVTAEDGVELSVEELDPADGGAPELTVILVHGYTLDRRSWLFQRHALAHSTAPRVRQVLYDHRSHGRSGHSHPRGCLLEQLGRDLHAVIRAAAPEGPLVLIGHSLGGMTIMALAEDHPELFADRICGVAFLNTSAGDVGRSGLPRPVLSRRSPAMPVAALLSHWEPSARVIQAGRDASRHLIWSLTRKLSFGDKSVNPAVVELMDTMIRETPFDVMSDFLATFGAHNRYAALAGLRYAKALVLGADRDHLIQYQHAEAIAALLPDAELVRVQGAGHVTMMEQPALVNEHLLTLLSRCAGNLPTRETSA